MQAGGLHQLKPAQGAGSARLLVGLDVVEVSRVRESLHHFGARYLRRLFSEAEIGYAMQGSDQCAERLAARFAAKEAAIKAFSLSEIGVGWRDIEVCKQTDGACHLALYGRAAEQATRLGVTDVALSLSHDGDYAGAVVTLLCSAAAAESATPSKSFEPDA